MTELVFRDDAYARSCAARVTGADQRGIRLDRTVFYPTGGGQPGDTGSLRLASGAAIAIIDTIKGDAPDEVIHVPAPGTALPEPGSEVTAELDWERRGDVDNVVFVQGAHCDGDEVYLTYGAADRCVGVATAHVGHLLEALRARASGATQMRH